MVSNTMEENKASERLSLIQPAPDKPSLEKGQIALALGIESSAPDGSLRENVDLNVSTSFKFNIFQASDPAPESSSLIVEEAKESALVENTDGNSIGIKELRIQQREQELLL